MRDWIDIISLTIFVVGVTVLIAWAATGNPEVARYLAQAL